MLLRLPQSAGFLRLPQGGYVRLPALEAPSGPPDAEGLEYALQPSRLHYRLTAGRLHVRAAGAPLHYRLPDEP